MARRSVPPPPTDSQPPSAPGDAHGDRRPELGARSAGRRDRQRRRRPLQRPPQHDGRLHAVARRTGSRSRRGRATPTAGSRRAPTTTGSRRRTPPATSAPPRTRPAATVTGDVTPPSAPGTLSAAGSIGRRASSWGAATDNVAVVRYNVHRSTSAGFVPERREPDRAADRARATPTSARPGTYFYKVTAEDAAGNIGAPSNEAVAAVDERHDRADGGGHRPRRGRDRLGHGHGHGKRVRQRRRHERPVHARRRRARSPDTSAPYGTSWVTTTATPGTAPPARRRGRRGRQPDDLRGRHGDGRQQCAAASGRARRRLRLQRRLRHDARRRHRQGPHRHDLGRRRGRLLARTAARSRSTGSTTGSRSRTRTTST